MANGILAIRIWSVTPETAKTVSPQVESHELRYFGKDGIRLFKSAKQVQVTRIEYPRRIQFYNVADSDDPQAVFDVVWEGDDGFLKTENHIEFTFSAKKVTKAAFAILFPSLVAAEDEGAIEYHRSKFWLDTVQPFETGQGPYFGEVRLYAENASAAAPLGQLSLGQDGVDDDEAPPISRLLGFKDAVNESETDLIVDNLADRTVGSMLRVDRFEEDGRRPFYLVSIERPLNRPVTWRIPYTEDETIAKRRPARLHYSLPIGVGQALAQVQRPEAWIDIGKAPKANAPLDWYVGIRHFDAGPILSMWNDLVALPYRNALQTVSDPSSLSIVPMLYQKSAAATGEGSWDILCPIQDKVGTEDIRREEAKLVRGEKDWPAVVHRSDVDIGVEPPLVNARAVGIFDHSGDNIDLEARLGGRATKGGAAKDKSSSVSGQKPAYVPAAARVFEFVLFDLVLKEPEGTTIRIGALDFEIAPFKPVAEAADHWSIKASIVPDHSPSAGSGADGVAVEAHGILRARRVSPAAQDPVPDEDRAPLGRSSQTDLAVGVEKANQAVEAKFEREPALVFVTGGESAIGTFELSFQEVTQKDRSRNVTVQLTETSGLGVGPAKVLVIDRQPFTVAEVTVPSFAARKSGLEGTEIANWEISEAEGRKWEIAGLEDGAEIRLPPQAIGEEMEKGDSFYQAFVTARERRPIGADDEFEQPFPEATQPAPDGYVPKPLDYRFSPPARFTVRTTYFDQRYVEAPWNLRRVFGYPGQRAPGAGVDKFDFELLYGLKGAAEDIPFLRLAEVESRLGAIPPRIPIISEALKNLPVDDLRKALWSAYKEHWQRWANATHAYRSRLGVLQLWAEGRSGELRLEKGIDYELIDFEAERRSLPDSPEAVLPADPIDPRPSEENDSDGSLAIGTRRFFGGAEWGFESRAVLNAVRRNRKSVSGELRRPGFSALGGFGWLKASFDNDLSRIYADVQLGRANFYSVERIGRIANLWHRAKHVIVYERTVVPSRQFRAQQPRHEGRPVVRKVQEYVELLEPVRRYPDGDGTAKLRGCLLGVDFKSRIIPVDGRWGHVFGDYGWAIPLWNPDSDPEVYPKPQIMFMGAADPESGSPFVPGILEEPEKLLFFTETTGVTANTDTWVARAGIDYSDEPARYPEYLDPNAVIDGEGPDRRLPDPPAVDGLGRFTYRLNFGGRAVNLAAGRSREIAGEMREIAMNAVLENMTFMRAKPVPPITHAETANDQTAAAAQRLFAEPLDFGDGITRPKNNLGASLASLDATLRGVVAEAAGSLTGALSLDRVQAQLRLALFGNEQGTGDLLSTIKDRLQNVEGQIRNTLTGIGKLDLDTAYDAVNKQCKALKDLPAATLNPARQALTSKLSELERGIDTAIGQLESTGNDLRKHASTLIDQQVALVQAALRPFSIGVDQFLGNVGGLRGEIARVQSDLSGRLRFVDKQAEALLAEIEVDFAKAKTAAADLGGRLAIVRSELTGSRDSARKALSKAAEGRFGKLSRDATRLAEESFTLAFMLIDRADGTLAMLVAADGASDQIRAGLADLRANVAGSLARIEAIVGAWLQAADHVLEGFEANVGELNGSIVAAIERLNTWPEKLRDEIHAAIANANGTSKDVADKVKEAIRAVSDEIDSIAETMIAKVAAPVDALCASLFDQLDRTKALEGEFRDAVKTFIDDELEGFLGASGAQIERSLDEVRAYLDTTIGRWRGQYNEFEDKFRTYVSGQNREALFQAGSAALRLMRGYGEGPILPQLKFNRDRLAYVFDDARDAILASPAAAMVNDVGQVLNGLGLRVPTQELLDRLIPHDIEKTLVAKVTEHLAGIRFLNMFSGLKMPAVAKDAIQIRHGLDKATQSAWLNADLKMPFGPATLFDLGPLNLKLLGAQLTAFARLTARLGQSPQQETYGELFGDWQLGFGGTKLVTFTRTTVSFDKSGHFKFDIRPDRIKLDRALEWLSDLVASWSDPDSGFLLELYEEGGEPRGVRALLDLSVPAISAGAFALSGLRLTSFLALRYGALPAGNSDFIIEAGASLGRRDAPFALTVYFLRGGGWLEAKALYATSSGRLSVAVTIGIVVGAGAEINFPGVSGSVSLEIGIFVEFYKNIGGGQGFSIGLMLLIRGRVMVIQIVSVGLTLMLSLTYTPGNGSMVGRGYLSITVKISRFFKYSVRRDVRYELAG